ncbi:MAG: hypothetical protein ACE5GZ_14015 [Gammaproteobacteria bacterium]
MPTRVNIPIAGQTLKDRTLRVNLQDSINLYPDVEGEGAESVFTLKSTPGLTLITNTAGNGPIRSDFHIFNSKAYFVSGPELMSLDTNDVVVSVGTLNTNAGEWVDFAVGRTYIMLVDGTDGYTYDGTTFATITDADFPSAPTHCTYLDGFFIVNNTNSDQVNISTNENPTAWSALEFTTADANPDQVLALHSTYRDLYLIGEITTQVYYNSGNLDFPFDLYPQGVLEWGTAAPASVTKAKGIIFMLGQADDGTVSPVMMQGFSVVKLFNQDQLDELQSMTTLSDAEGFAYHQNGNTFYQLTFPTENKTFVYHVEQNMVHKRQSFDIGRHRGRGHGVFNNRHLIGDYQAGQIYYYDLTNYTENGNTIERIRKTAITHSLHRRITIFELEIEFDPGIGLLSGQGSDPQARLSYSPDGGRTYSDPLFRSIGKVGDYQARAIFEKLGTQRQFNFDIRVSDPVPVTIIDAFANIKVRKT